MAYIIVICGPSCAGKTYLAQYIKSLATSKVTLLGFDAYCNDYGHLSKEEIKNINYDCPDAYDGTLLFEHVKMLKLGLAIERPIYDFATHHRLPITERVSSSDIIVVEGIMTFQVDKLLDIADLKVFIDAREDVTFNRRFDRDQRERGRSPESIIYQFNTTVIPMRKIYIDPMKVKADIVLTNNENNGPLPMARPLIERIEDLLK